MFGSSKTLAKNTSNVLTALWGGELVNLPKAVGQKARCCLWGHATYMDKLLLMLQKHVLAEIYMLIPSWEDLAEKIKESVWEGILFQFKMHLVCISPGKNSVFFCAVLLTSSVCLAQLQWNYLGWGVLFLWGQDCVLARGLLHPGTEGLAPQRSWWLQRGSLRADWAHLMDFFHPLTAPTPSHCPGTPAGTAKGQGREQPLVLCHWGEPMMDLLPPCWGAGHQCPLPLHRARAAILPSCPLLPGSSELPSCMNDVDFETMSRTDKRKILTDFFKVRLLSVSRKRMTNRSLLRWHSRILIIFQINTMLRFIFCWFKH